MKYVEYGKENKEVVILLPGLYHGEFFINHAKEYAERLIAFVKEGIL